MHQPAQLLGGWRQSVGTDHLVHCLGRGEMVADRANAAQPLDDNRDFPVHPAADEAFKAAELNDVETRFIDFAGLVQANGHFAVAFDASDRIDHDLARSGACVSAVHDAPPPLAWSTARPVIRI
jgi:hypothetical protein